jgi:hypothetical protein
MEKQLYLLLILFWKCKFDILFFVKSISIKFIKNLWVFTKYYACKMLFDHFYKSVYIIWINKLE